MKILMNNLPEGSYREGYCPHLKTIRWKSLYKCVSFVIENFELFQNSNDEKVTTSLDKITTRVGLNHLQQLLSIMWNFILNVEKDHACIANIIPPFFNTYLQLKRINTNASQKLADYFVNRFTLTCPFQLPLYAYLVTKPGLWFYRSCDLTLQDLMKMPVKLQFVVKCKKEELFKIQLKSLSLHF